MAWSEREAPGKVDCLSVSARRHELKLAVQKAAAMEKAKQLLEESEALASINPAKRISYQYSDYTAAPESCDYHYKLV